MIINELSLTNFRSYESAKFAFKPGVNLIAGVNGAGKSTALDAIRILMSRASREILKSRETLVDVGLTDIRRGADFAFLSIEFGMPFGPDRTVYQFEGQVNREDYVPGTNQGDVRDEGSTIQTGFHFVMPKPLFQAPGGQPLCIHFSPHRSILTQEATFGSAHTSAFANALSDRRFNLRQAADWWLGQESLASEHERYGKRADAIQRAILKYLPSTIQLVRPIPQKRDDKDPKKIIEHAKLLATKDGQDFDLFALSDGERGVLALVFDIARRLAIAYPELEDPIKEGAACILVDEIELHLHPQWQRDVPRWLERTFPKCQFIVTTHSATVVSEFEPDRIWFIALEGIWQPYKSRGLDISRVIDELMGASSRTSEFEALLAKISSLIISGAFKEARSSIDELTKKLGENDPEVVRAESMLIFAEGTNDSDS